MRWHPRDLDTWLMLEELDASEQRMAAARRAFKQMRG